MIPEELTTIATAHQSAISRHDQEMADIRATLGAVGQKLDQVAGQLDRVADQQNINSQAIASLSASVVELRNTVADSIQKQSST